jgi:hypothetical protein
MGLVIAVLVVATKEDSKREQTQGIPESEDIGSLLQ